MTLQELASLIPGSRIVGDPAVVIRGIAHDSRAVRSGDLFVCLVGERYDGHLFAGEALAQGAAAVCIKDGRPETAGTFIAVPDTRRALPAFAAAVYGHPSRTLKMIGVTGTNGKTTSTLMAASILRAIGFRSGTIGTLGAEVDGYSLPSDRTTPEADQLQALLKEMRIRGAEAVTMEVSSHALAQYRTDGCEYDGAIFTNLTQDHLDYHKTIEDYFEAKLRLFRDYPAASAKTFVASVNIDDPRGSRVVEATNGTVVTYGLASSAEVTAREVSLDPGQVRFTAHTPSGTAPVHLRIGGSFQVYNALGAIALFVGMGYDLSVIARGLGDLRTVPGRFESVPTGRGFHVVVDYAHSPDGIRNLLESARKLDPERIITVFGCGGDRDRTKRPIMGRLAGSGSDVVVVTSDNPRSEDPRSIIEEILPGLADASAKVMVEPDRREAIRMAVREARDGDLVVVAGKGHEDYQEINGVKYPFDDREVVRTILEGQE